MTVADAVVEVNEFVCYDSLRKVDLSDDYEDLTDESNVCEDDLAPVLSNESVLPAELSDLREVADTCSEDFDVLQDGCNSPGLELRTYDIDSFPPRSPEFAGKLTVVFDLDETLAHARDGIIRPRPHLQELFKVVQDRCEPLIWTAGVRTYAQRVVTALDPDHVIKQCICRTDTWFPTMGPMSHVKDLRLLNRDMDRVIIIENTPDCVLKNPLNSIIVSDYVRENPSDTTLQTLACVLDGLIESPLPVPQYLATCPLVRLETLRNPNGDTLTVFMLR